MTTDKYKVCSPDNIKNIETGEILSIWDVEDVLNNPYCEKESTMEYCDLVKALLKPSADILDNLTPARANLIHLAMGVAGEAGEIIDSVKKHTIYNKPVDIVNLIEELGDMEFYLEAIRQHINVTREEVLKGNMEKLKVRYSKLTYSDTDAQLRADKA